MPVEDSKIVEVIDEKIISSEYLASLNTRLASSAQQKIRDTALESVISMIKAGKWV